MTKYLISFDDGSMDHIRDEEWASVAEASHAVVHEAKDAGVWVFGGGLRRQSAITVAAGGAVVGSVEPEAKAMVGGFAVVEVESLQEAVQWAGRIAAGCRCAQEVREIMDDPES